MKKEFLSRNRIMNYAAPVLIAAALIGCNDKQPQTRSQATQLTTKPLEEQIEDLMNPPITQSSRAISKDTNGDGKNELILQVTNYPDTTDYSKRVVQEYVYDIHKENRSAN